ncbi:TetR/AcrR family transcriptional regulator [Salipaludibacillus daqingensis]|uniref:TetR/AcrR family transcriptional regulator n=1 Tax=Salipaludibacillus daqingensis TaxID=3041001 RepID=UPI002473C26B|nr:TetR/AcrR family transcriptional regulator [Salipaludibacillus daqingensis]
MNSKLDRRKKYTRMVLKNSLMTLLKEKSILAVTVKEICALADINRSTFYSHFQDQFDLLNQIEEEIIHDMNETLSAYNFNQGEETLQMTEKIVEYVAENSDVCITLFSEHGDSNFKKRVMMVASEHTIKNGLSMYPIDSEITEYVSMFAISGSIHVVENWLKNGMDKSPKEIAELINNLTNKGLSYLNE